MDLGDLVFFVIFIIIIASNIIKQVKKQKKATDAQPAEAKTGWKKTMEDILKDIRTQMEQNVEPASGKPGRPPLGWEDLIGPEPEERQLPQKETQPQATVRMHPRPVPDPPGRGADFEELRGKGPEALKGDWDKKSIMEKKTRRAMKKPTSALPAPGSLSKTNLPGEDLINAVIWHEILSPPLGLRNF
jgi:hypothetical protein